MSKPVKDMITKELHSRYATVDSALWVEFVGIDGNTTNDFRRELRANNIRMEIVKNSLFQRAVAGGPLERMARDMSGPVALVTGGESIIDAAKLLDTWRRKLEGVIVRGAVIEGEYIEESRAGQVHKMPTKRDVQAKLSAIVLSPGGKLASAIRSGGGNIAGCLKTIIEKLEKDEPIANVA